uniref:Uncharacterized protein n=1 Tax=Arundo donax TaxID=35708 RepID=A0A0A9E247_ARUDO
MLVHKAQQDQFSNFETRGALYSSSSKLQL